MYLKNAHILLLLLALVSTPSFAGFPNDLDDVVFIEEGTRSNNVGLTQFVRDMAVTGILSVDISGSNPFGGQNVNLINSKSLSWPNTIFDCCNANAWIVVKVGETWYAGTWEFMRVGQVTKSTVALTGEGHIKYPPLSDFLPKVGEIYGFFNSCLTRNGIDSKNNNCRERTNVALYQYGVGPVGFDAIEVEVAKTPVLAPIINLLNE